MKYFSEKFLQGLATKSENFQYGLASAIQKVDSYINDEDEIKKFHEWVEADISYDHPGNIILPAGADMYGGGNKKPFAEEVLSYVMGEFDNPFEDEDDEDTKRKAIQKITHLIVCVRSPEGQFSDQDMNTLLLFLHMLTLKNDPKCFVVQDTVRDNYPRGVYILGLK